MRRFVEYSNDLCSRWVCRSLRIAPRQAALCERLQDLILLRLLAVQKLTVRELDHLQLELRLRIAGREAIDTETLCRERHLEKDQVMLSRYSWPTVTIGLVSTSFHLLGDNFPWSVPHN